MDFYKIYLMFFLILFGLNYSILDAQDIRINEVMSSNSEILDEDEDTPDWLELYNYGNDPINLKGWHLSDNITKQEKWAFPDMNINSEEFVIIWASGKDRITTVSSLENHHTNFKISSSGETIYLFNEGGKLVDSMLVQNIPTNLSTGISTQSGDQVVFTTTTPGAQNDVQSFQGVLEPTIIFSEEGGHVNPFSLELSIVDTDCTLRYTLDTSEPDMTSPIYNEALKIDKTTVVRAKIFKQDYVPSTTQSNAYRIGNVHSLPVIDLITDSLNLYDENDGIYILGPNADTVRPFTGANFWQEWERPVNFRYTIDDESYAFDGGMRITGNYSRFNAQKSLAIFARQRYGTDEINFPFFENLEYNTFQALVMRNSGSDWLRTMFRDGLMSSLMKDSGLAYQAYQPTVTYLNGKYCGIYNLREKVNEHFIVSKYGGKVEDLTILKNDGTEVFGKSDEYLNLIEFVSSNDLSIDVNYTQVEEQVDIENMIAYQASQIYFGNHDWPGNNIKYFKLKDSKWRWILFDLDWGFDNRNITPADRNTLKWALDPNGPDWPNPPWSTLLFRKLIENLEYRNRFINHFADEMNSRFLFSNVESQIDKIVGLIQTEITDHYERWNGNLSYWEDQVQLVRDIAEERSTLVKGHILEQFSLPNYHTLSIINQNPEHGYVKLNSLTIDSSDWKGDYFETVPIELTAVPNEGYKFSHWQGASLSTDQEISLDLQQESSITPIFTKGDNNLLEFVINEINYKSNDNHDTDDWIEIYNPSTSSEDLSNYVIKDNDDEHSFLIPAGTMINSNGYLVITKDKNKFTSLYPDVSNIIGDIDFGFSSSEDDVRLYDPSDRLIDSVTYSSESPWPEGASGQGFTLELSDPELDNAKATSWANINELGSPGKTNLKSTSTKNLPHQNEITVSPNPTNGILNIEFKTIRATDLTINILDLNGKLVKKINSQSFSPGVHNTSVDTSNLSKGIYLISIADVESKRFSLKRFLKIE